VSDILLDTKIRIPSLRSNLVNRLHLIQKLNDGIDQGCCLTLISAPAGYGKSTLLSEWVSQVGIPTAWLSLEKGENTPTRFWSYLLAALSSIPHMRNAGIGESLIRSLHSTKPPLMDGLLTELVNDIARLDQSAILVLDDLHTILDGQIHQDLIFLIDHLPRSTNGLHLAVASRMDPPWPLARWRVRDELNELRPADLRFSSEETGQFLSLEVHLNLSSEDIAALQDRTEGWIAGLQMAAVSMQARLQAQGSHGVSRFIESFSGSNRFILDYLMEEVISQQPVEIGEFLHETSILAQLTAPLCDVLLERRDSRAVLDYVEQANLFLIPLDDERQWYRYHHLFAELLRKRLVQTRPDRITELHQRASHWYAEHYFLSEAIDHALEARDFVRVNDLVSGNSLVIIEHTELVDVLRHFEEIADSLIFSKPWLGLAYAWVKAYADPSAGMDRILQKIEQGLTSIENPVERQRLTNHLAAIRAYVAWVKGDADEALVYAQTVLKTLPEDDWPTRAHLLNIEGLALQYTGNLRLANQSFEAAIVAGQRTGGSYEILTAYTNLAYLCFLQGRLNQAFSLCQQVFRLADQSSQALRRMPVLAYAYGTMSLVQLEWNEVESAISSARESVALAEEWKQADALHFALTCLSQALCAAGDLEPAFAVNQRAMQLALQVSSWFYRLSALNEVRLDMAKGDIDAADYKMKELESLVTERDKRYTFLIYKASLLQAQGNYLEVITTIEKIIDEFEQNELNWYRLNLIPLQALASQALGREEEAIGVIGQCLTLAKPEGFVRIFVEQGAPMLRLLQVALSRGIETGYIHKLLPAFTNFESAPQSDISTTIRIQPTFQTANLAESLSEREIQVLRLLDSALTSEEIGRELFVSVNTVRTHIRNIYAKLGVNRRGDAVQRAQNLDLM